MKNDRLDARGFSFEKDAHGHAKPFLYCKPKNGELKCLPGQFERKFQEVWYHMRRRLLCTIEVYTATFEETTYEHKHLIAIQMFGPDPVCEQEREAYAAWLAIEVEREVREDREREAAFQKFLHSDMIEAWLRARPRSDDNKFLHGSPQTQREHLQRCYSLHGSPGSSAWEYLREDRAAAMLERLKDIAARIRAEEKAKYVKT